MDIKDFHITLINGERIFQTKDSVFGIIDSQGEFLGTASDSTKLLHKNVSAICICTIAGRSESMKRIILRESILSFDKNSESLSRNVIIEKQAND